jgi:hypothetical protein
VAYVERRTMIGMVLVLDLPTVQQLKLRVVLRHIPSPRRKYSCTYIPILEIIMMEQQTTVYYIEILLPTLLIDKQTILLMGHADGLQGQSHNNTAALHRDLHVETDEPKISNPTCKKSA